MSLGEVRIAVPFGGLCFRELEYYEISFER